MKYLVNGQTPGDDYVVEFGADRHDYAGGLMDVAELTLEPVGAGGIGVVSIRSLLGRRIKRMLDTSRPLSTRLNRVLLPVVLTGGLSATLLAGLVSVVDKENDSPKLNAATDVEEVNSIASTEETSSATVGLEEKKTSMADMDEQESSTAFNETLRGTVRDEDDRPLADAPVYLLGYVEQWGTSPGKSRGWQHIFTSTRTDAAGRFALTATVDSTNRYVGFQAVALPPGYAIAFGSRTSDLNKASENGYQIIAEAQMPIKGRILSPLGEPIQGAKVQLAQILRNAGSVTGISIGIFKGDSDLIDPIFEFWPDPIETDEEGRFRFDVASSKSLTTFMVEADGYAPARIRVATLEIEAAVKKMLNGSLELGNPFKPFRQEFTYLLEPPLPLVGVVTDAETGRPVEGTKIEFLASDNGMYRNWRLSSKTNAEGRYHINAPSFVIGSIRAPSPDGFIEFSDSLDGDETEKAMAGKSILRHDIKLTRGTLVRGSVVDADTGKPVSDAAVTYRPKKGNALQRSRHRFTRVVLTDAEGRFEIRAVQGNGLLLVELQSPHYLKTTLSKDLIGESADTYPHSYVEIEVPVQDEWSAPPLMVRKGVTIEVQTIGLNGQPVDELFAASLKTGATMTHANLSTNHRPYRNGTYRMNGVDPQSVYRTFFLTADFMAGTFTDLKYDPDEPGPREVLMQPTATVRGRLIYENGKPADGILVSAKFLITDDDGEEIDFLRDRSNRIAYLANMTKINVRTNENGEFEVVGVFPDTYIVIGLNQAFLGGKRTQRIGKLETGEVRDLGELKLER